MGLRVLGSGFRVWDSRFRVQGRGGLGCRGFKGLELCFLGYVPK